MTKLRPLMLAPIALMMAACGEEAAEPAPREIDSSAEASGEVLGGSISDDMLPLEQLRSQSPAAPRAPDADGAGAASSSSSDEGADDEASFESEPDSQEAEASEDAPAPETAPETEAAG